MKNIKHYFAGTNTNEGFINKFHNINISGGMTYILKGGPGTGKSTLMKNIGNHFANKNETVEFFHCSSDPDSLDGIFLPAKKIAIVDGTAPHVCEATMPNISEIIINLGEFIGKTVQKSRKKVQKLIENKQKQYNLAYLFLQSAGIIYKTNELLSKQNSNNSFENIIKDLNIKSSTKFQKRELFLSTISKNRVTNLSELNEYEQTKFINCSQSDNHEILAQLSKHLENIGVNHITFGELLYPEKIEAIFISDINTILISKPKTTKTDILKNQKIISRLCNRASSHIEKAKYFHKKVEKIYLKSTNFEAISVLTQNLMKQIEQKKTSL